MPTPKGNRGAAQIFSHPKCTSGSGKKTNGILSPASLDVEDTALGFHAYPPVSSKCSITKYDQTSPPPVLQPFRNDNEDKPDNKYRKCYTLNDYVASMASMDSFSQARNPDLGKAYRRPKMLLPEHLRSPSAPLHDRTSHITSVNILEGQRPHIRRTPASTSVHRLDVVGGMAKSASVDQQSLRPLLQEGDASGHGGILSTVGLSPRKSPIRPSESTHAARRAFLNFLGHQPHQKAEQKLQPQHTIKQTPPLLSLNGVLLPDQPVLANDCRIGAENAISSNSLHKARTDIGMSGTSLEQTLVAHRSTKATNEIWISILAVALEISSSIEFDQLLRHVLKAVTHGPLAARRTPWAVRTLMNRDADVRNYLLAARCILVTSFYLIILLSVIAAGFRALELLVEIGHCIWYPFGVLLSVAGWILTP